MLDWIIEGSSSIYIVLLVVNHDLIND